MSTSRTIPLLVPLAAFERRLLAEISPLLPSPLPTPSAFHSTIKDIYRGWYWANLAWAALKDDVSAKQVKQLHKGDYREAYEDYLSRIAHLDEGADGQFRADSLRAANPDLLGMIENGRVDSLFLMIPEEDADLWKRLHWMDAGGHLVWESEMFTRRRTFDVYKSIHSFYHRKGQVSSRPGPLASPVLSGPLLLEEWEVETKVVLRPRNTESAASQDTRAKNTEAFNYAPVEGILEHVEILDIRELQEVPASRMDQPMESFIPFWDQLNNQNLRWVEWTPPTHTPLGSHLLHTEDELYQYCVDKNWCFPDPYSEHCAVPPDPPPSLSPGSSAFKNSMSRIIDPNISR